MKYLLIYLAAVNAVLFLTMGADKRAARRGLGRVPERVLFALAVVGGSLGGLLGMIVFRHKTRKPLFALGFPLLLALHGFLLWRFALRL